MSGVSTVESPQLEVFSDHGMDLSSDDQEFSTGVSSTRKRRRHFVG